MFERWRPAKDKIPPLTKAQRTSILNRDDHTPQERGYNENRGWHKAHDPCPYDRKPCDSMDVHHIVPRSTRDATNEPTNLITVASCFHTGRCRSGRIR